MKPWGWIGVIALAAVGVFAVNSAVQTQHDPERAREHAQEETKEAWNATQNYVEAKREQASDQVRGSDADEQLVAARKDAERRAEVASAKVNELAAGAAQQVRSVQSQTAQTMGQMTQAASQESQKELYQEQVEQRLDRVSQQIDDLQDRAESVAENVESQAAPDATMSADASAEVKAELDAMLDDLEQKREQAQRELGELKDADEATWQVERSSLEQSLNDLERAYNQTRARIESRSRT